MTTRQPKAELEIAPTLALLDAIAKHLILTGEKAREERDFSNSIGAFVQATNVMVTSHQIQERFADQQSADEAESQQSSGPGGLRGRYPVYGREEENL